MEELCSDRVPGVEGIHAEGEVERVEGASMGGVHVEGASVEGASVEGARIEGVGMERVCRGGGRECRRGGSLCSMFCDPVVLKKN